MKQFYAAFFILSVFLSLNSNAQTCTPDPTYTATPGVHPDSAANFSSGVVNTPYNQNITVVVPQDTVVPPLPWPIPFDSIHLVSIQNLPNGLTYMCSPAGCTWLGGTYGCAAIYGTPTTADTFNLTITVNAYVGGSTAPVPQTLDYYRIIISPAVGINENSNFTYEVKQNIPNPFSGKTTIKFSVPSDDKVKICVYNVIGKVVLDKKVNAVRGDNEVEIDGRQLQDGMYFYTVEYKGKTVTRRMMVSSN